jgi:hypothetical protein
MQLIETMLGRLGSRFTLHFLPREKLVRISPLGKYYDLPWHLTLGFRVGNELRVLPFAGPDTPTFPEVEMELTMTSVTFRARDRQLGLAATFKFVSPFYPYDEPLCTAPLFYLDATLDSAPHDQPVEFVAGLKLAEGEARLKEITAIPAEFTGGILETEYSQIKTHWGPRQPPDNLSEKTFTAPLFFGMYNYPDSPEPEASIAAKPDLNGNAINIRATDHYNTLQPGESLHLLLATYLNEPVLEIKTAPHYFIYTRSFENLEQVLGYAHSYKEQILNKTAQLDSLLLNSSFGKSKVDFIAFTFQSYLPNSWWTYPRTSLDNTDGDTPNSDQIVNRQSEIVNRADWFSLWEGNCTFHSTVDVEYNLAWIYLLLWPEMLETTISEWRGYLQKDERGEWMSHDIGGLLGANHQVYPHQMEVEENCNFILLTYALWRFTGRDEIRRDNLDVVARLVRFILDSDTSGNGFPDRGTANTVDDASPAVQFGREQTYLAVKALSACWAASLLLKESSEFRVPSSELGTKNKTIDKLPDQSPDLENRNLGLETRNSELIEECLNRVALINETLDWQAWLGDHFAVTLDRRTEGLIHPWTGQPLPPGELEGWNSYSIYTANGLLYLLATDTANGSNLPPGLYERYRQDIMETLPRALIEYGCTHSSSDRSHIWVSQNLHRDYVAAYLGEDLSELVDRYWAFEQYENSQGRGGCFVDTYGGNHLRYYPRGITSLGLLYALAGLRLDRVSGRLQFKPVRVPLRVPIPTLADWSAGRIPWANFRLQDGKVVLELENEDLLEGLTVELL